MQHHIEQARHNQTFYDCIENQFIGQFHDWKITVLFYITLHYLKALAALRGIHIGERHYDIEQNVNPDRPNAKMRITKNAWREYKSLFHYFRTARYEGITDINTFEQLKQLDHAYCIQHLENLKKYLQGQGLRI